MRGQHHEVGRDCHRQSGRNAWIARLVTVASCVVILGSISRPGFAEDRFEVAGFLFSPPTSWVRQLGASSMRAAQFLVPNPGTRYDGLVVYYRFPPGLGGSADRNIARWYSQFKESNEALGATIETRGKAGHQLHYFRATGTLIGRDGELPDYALHAALLDGPAGWMFVRFVAPNAVARANETAFGKLIERAFGG